jgi:hypothetical protein
MDPLEAYGLRNAEAWRSALPGGDDRLLDQLVREEPPDAVHLAIMSYTNNMYYNLAVEGFWSSVWSQFSGQGDSPAPGGGASRSVFASVGRAQAKLQAVRQTLGPQLRDIDLGLLRMIRDSRMLSVVLGAGATMAAGGPSWAALVQRMLNLALDGDSRAARLERSQERSAHQIVALIESGEADTEALMRGAQLCYDLFGQGLFTHFHSVLYEGNRQPSEIHRAIAKLAYSPETEDPDRASSLGWDCIVSYNFDDLMGEALDAEDKARVAWAMRGDNMAGDPNTFAEKTGPEERHQDIYHLHGYTPRRLFKITQVAFVFSASQFEELYPKGNELIDRVLDDYLMNPIHHALYVGCSFDDNAMNSLLQNSWQQWPGRWHYALLEWQGRERYTNSTAGEINMASGRYTDLGVQPVWFDEFDEIPAMILGLE